MEHWTERDGDTTISARARFKYYENAYQMLYTNGYVANLFSSAEADPVERGASLETTRARKHGEAPIYIYIYAYTLISEEKEQSEQRYC